MQDAAPLPTRGLLAIAGFVALLVTPALDARAGGGAFGVQEVAGGTGEGFSEWQESHFTSEELADPEISGPGATPAADEVQNLLKYAFGLSPKLSATADDLIEVEFLEGQLLLSYVKPLDRPDLIYTAEVSQDLAAGWWSGPEFTTEVGREPFGDGAELVTIAAVLPADAARGFLRVMVEFTDGTWQIPTDAMGFVSLDFLAGSDTRRALPLHRPAVFQGAVTAVSNQTIYFANGIDLDPAVEYFAAVRTGASAGLRGPVVLSGEQSVTIDPGVDISGVVESDFIQIAPYWTLETLFLDKGLDGTQVLLFDRVEEGADLAASSVFEYDAGDGEWRDAVSQTLAGTTVIPQTESFIIRNLGPYDTEPEGHSLPVTGSVPRLGAGSDLGWLSDIQGELPLDIAFGLSYPVPVPLEGAEFGQDGDQLLVYDNQTAGINKGPAAVYTYIDDETMAAWSSSSTAYEPTGDVQLEPEVGYVYRKNGSTLEEVEVDSSVTLLLQWANFGDAAEGPAPAQSLYGILVDVEGNGLDPHELVYADNPDVVAGGNILAFQGGMPSAGFIGGAPGLLRAKDEGFPNSASEPSELPGTGDQWGVIWFPELTDGNVPGVGDRFGFYANENMTIPPAGHTTPYADPLPEEVRRADSILGITVEGPDLLMGGSEPRQFSITYAGVDSSTVEYNDSAIRFTGPNGFEEFARYAGIEPVDLGLAHKVTYWIDPPDGEWTASNRGQYTIHMEGEQITDLNGVYLLPTELDTFVAELTDVPPEILTQPENQTVNGGDSVTFGITYAGIEPFYFRWYHDGVSLDGVTEPILTLDTAGVGDEGHYHVVVTDAVGTVASDEAFLSVASTADSAEIINQPESSRDVALGSSVALVVEAVGEGELQYQWRLNGVNIPGATGSSYTIESVEPRHAGIYTVSVGDDRGSVVSQPAELTLGGLEQVTGNDLFAQPHVLDTAVASGIVGSNNLEAVREDGEPLHAGRRGGRSIWFAWTPRSAGIATFSTAGSAFDTVLAAYRGTELASLEEVRSNVDEPGAFLTSKIQFNVREADLGQTYYIAVDGFAGAGGDVVLAWDFEETTSFLPELTQMSPPTTTRLQQELILDFGADTQDGEWLQNNVPTGVTTREFAIESMGKSHVGLYSIRLRSDTDPEREVVTPPIDIQIHMRGDGVEDPDSFAFSKFQETVDQAGIRFADTVDPAGFSSASSGPATGFSSTQIFSTHESSKEAGEPNHCGESGGASKWYAYQAEQDGMLHVNTDGSDFRTVLAVYTGPGTDFESLVEVDCDVAADSGSAAVVIPAAEGDIFWVAVDGVGGVSGTVELNFHIGDPVEILQNPESQSDVVAGSEVIFSTEATGSPELSYQWYFDDVEIFEASGATYTIAGAAAEHEGEYHVVVSNLVNEVASSKATLSVVVPPEITAGPEDQTVNEGEAANLSVTAAGTEPFTYQWLHDGAPMDGETGATLTFAAASAEDAGTYSVEVANGAGLVTSAGATLTVNVPPEITAHPEDQTVNEGEVASFSVTATGTEPLTYQWFHGDAPMDGETETTLVFASMSAGDAGTYSVEVTNVAGSVTSVGATLTVNVPPEITAGPASRTVPPGGSFALSVFAEGTPAPSYQWFHNGGELSGETGSELSISGFDGNDEGDYQVSVRNPLGDVMSDVAVLRLDSPARIDGLSLEGDVVEFLFIGPAGRNYTVEGSPDLENWSSLETLHSANGYIDFTETGVSTFEARFYRVAEEEE